MSVRYKCNDCGLVWDDVEVKDLATRKFIRCIRCASRNIAFPKPETFRSTILRWVIVSVIAGIIGAGIGIWNGLANTWGNPRVLGLTGVLVDFFIPTIILFVYYVVLDLD